MSGCQINIYNTFKFSWTYMTSIRETVSRPKGHQSCYQDSWEGCHNHNHVRSQTPHTLGFLESSIADRKIISSFWSKENTLSILLLLLFNDQIPSWSRWRDKPTPWSYHAFLPWNAPSKKTYRLEIQGYQLVWSLGGRTKKSHSSRHPAKCTGYSYLPKKC